jgi:hypothetical protein
MDTIKECFETILNRDKEESRMAARRVRKAIYSAPVQGRENKFEDIKNIINNAAQTYAGISEDWRQENFVMAVSVIYFLHEETKHPDFLFPWFFQLLQHPNGYIRHSAVKMFTNELGPLTVYIRIPDYKPSKEDRVGPKESEEILYHLFLNLDRLLDSLWEPRFKRYKYVDSLPVGSYKSVQMVLAEMEDMCGKEYIDALEFRVGMIQ